jgi:broad specificity phosphatase PhoE
VELAQVASVQTGTCILHIARHGAMDARGVCYGQLDLPSIETHEDVAERIASQLALPVTLVVSSPLLRARGPAERLAARYACTLQVTDELMELSMGQWEGKLFSEIEGSEAFQAWMAAWETARPPGGESTVDLGLRIAHWLRQASALRIACGGSVSGASVSGASASDLQNSGWLAVAHAGVIRSLYVLAGGTWIEAMQRTIGYGSVHTFLIEFVNGDVRVDSVARPPLT